MRPIDADKLKRKVQRIATEAWMMKLNASVETTLNQFLDYIDQAPTIEPKRGEWVDAEIRHKDGVLPIQVCSECKTFYPLEYTGGGHRFCPNCGASMREREDE